ncbi:MAG: EamA family transporter, partial [Candidatus Poseidoniaceae archaeon]|nr:EamA family transporter [Candidatus Poseidoniaceae archaeon]
GRTVTVWGDFLAFLGAVFVVGYIVSGRVLRKWMPIFLYAFPVTLIGALILIPASYLIEDDFSSMGAVGWIQAEYFWWFLALALIAGLLGHTGLNTCLRYMPPLVVSTSVTMEPIIGSVIGFILFDTGLPGFWTWLGGPILISGILMVIIGSSQENTNNETVEV